jgi:glycosyltransferase involved in cell wall biosynthesis/2-polyprenyl-3-methyl-5-hydroxy-6-metoxy-1,4-benzoquinol methylase
VVRCVECGLLFLNPQPSDAELAAIYTATYFLGGDSPEHHAQVAQMKGATAVHYLREIGRYRGGHGGRLLEIGCGRGEFLAEAQRVGYEVTGVEISESSVEQARVLLGADATVFCGEVETVPLNPGDFDVCVLADVIEHARDPLGFLRTIHRLLKPDGVLFIATPSLDSWSARLMRQSWMEFKPEHLTYFDTRTIQTALYRTGFHQLLVRPGWKVLNLGYVAAHFARYPVSLVTPLVRALARLTPRRLRDWNVPIVASGMGVLARATTVPRHPKLSVIVPAYNEAATFEPLMKALLAKEVPGCDFEVIVVESNSTDGTRELARRYEGHPRVRLVLEEQPRGKGRAVRTGLEHATGDFVLIQDADLEYDLEDYDALLEPLLQGQVKLVLGSRHGGGTWKMRRFTDQKWLSATLNLGHWFFTTLVNLLFWQRLKDPFTMFKVFRRDFLYGLTFTCNRFDFDYELLIKLVRKGYRPIEIPVNYRSRSFKEGKKVSVVWDPLTWLWALLRLRLMRVDPLAEAERQRRARAAVPDAAPANPQPGGGC